jgi:hypothetical protein
VRFTFLCVQLAAFVWMGALVVLHAEMKTEKSCETASW